MHPSVFQVLNLKWDRPLIDLFTTSLNHELEMYISSIPDQKAWAVTCFIRYFLILEWNLQLHLLPFSSCSQESLNKIQMIGCMTIMIATAYPRQTGFLNLLLLFFFWQISFFFHREWTFSRNLRERSYIRG